MRNDIISRLADWKGCVTSCWGLGQSDTKFTTSEARKRKEQKKEKWGKEEARSLRKQKKKSVPYFPSPGRAPPFLGTLSRTYLVFPNWKQLIGKPYICLPQRQTRHAGLRDLCRAHCFAMEAQEIVWYFCIWGWMYLQPSHSTVSKYKSFVWDSHRCCWKLYFQLNLAL